MSLWKYVVAEGGELVAEEIAMEGRRRLLRIDRGVVVSLARDAEAHADPGRRGGYLLKRDGRTPEIVLDGLSSERERREAERRCLNQLAREDAAREAALRLREFLRQRRGPVR